MTGSCNLNSSLEDLYNRYHDRNVRIGTSGWNYPTGQGTWNGIFYPLPRGAAQGRSTSCRSMPSTSTRSR